MYPYADFPTLVDKHTEEFPECKEIPILHFAVYQTEDQNQDPRYMILSLETGIPWYGNIIKGIKKSGVHAVKTLVHGHMEAKTISRILTTDEGIISIKKRLFPE